MAQELAYVIITPYTLYKSRTGGIITRLITRSGMELVSARMFAPSQALVDEYAAAIVPSPDPVRNRAQDLIREYVRQQLAPDPKSGRRRRVMLLLFKGDNAVSAIRSTAGDLRFGGRVSGQTIRDTFGDLVLDEESRVRYFEPAILCAPKLDEAITKCKIWARYSDADGGVVRDTIPYEPGETPQRTLVLLKPDNFRFPSGRPGNMIDFFSRAGLFIVGIKLHRMSVAEAVDFYGPVRETLRTKMWEMVGNRAKAAVEQAFGTGFLVPPDVTRKLGEALCPVFGDFQFANIVRFMSGRTPSECQPADLQEPGTERCIAILYEGVDAVRKIRDVLGPTDPSKAPPGSIRREFGQSVMVNAAHASDSEENARREMGIVNLAENDFREAVEEVYGE